MAYCRWETGRSDVFVFATEHGLLCALCRLDGFKPRGTIYDGSLFRAREAMLQHLLLHREHGHLVPSTALAQIQAEIAAAEQP